MDVDYHRLDGHGRWNKGLQIILSAAVTHFRPVSPSIKTYIRIGAVIKHILGLAISENS